MKLIFRRSADETRGWPTYILGGRVRTSTAGLALAFVALFWVNQNYQPEPGGTQQDQTQQVVPPGFVPDPNYTWVPRTNVRSRESEVTTTTTTTPTTPTTSPTEPTTLPGITTAPTGPAGPTTTVIDPDGPGPQSPQTFTQAPPSTSTPATTSAVPVPPTTASTR
jgi:hypothetical protein